MKFDPKFLAVFGITAIFATASLAQQANTPATKIAAPATTQSPFTGIASVPPQSLGAMIMVVTNFTEAESLMVRTRCNDLMKDPNGRIEWKDTCTLFNLAEIMHPREEGHEGNGPN